MANQEPFQESSYISLGSKVTSIPLNDVSISPTKKNEPKAIYLLGTRIPVPSQESLDETAKKSSRVELIDQRIMGFYENSMFLFSASPMKTDQNSKTHCSFDAESSTSMTLTDVSVSPTKKNDSKAIYLFGTRIPAPPQESYSLVSTATSKRSRTTLLGRVCLGSNPKEMSLVSASPIIKRDENLKTHCLINAESSKNPKEELKEYARKIKKTIKKKERNEENRVRVSMELDLNIPHCTITKTLTPSDVNALTRLMIETSPAESHILRYMSEADQRRIQEGNGVKVKVYDHDTGTEHDLVFKRWIKTSKSYLFNGGWGKEFVRRRDLKEGDKIGLIWDDFESRLHFRVLSRAPANQ